MMHSSPPVVAALPPEWRMDVIVVAGGDLQARHTCLKAPRPRPECRAVVLLVFPADGPGSHVAHLMSQCGAQASLSVQHLVGRVTQHN